MLDEASRTIQKGPAHPSSLIIVHVGVGQRYQALDVESSTTLPTINMQRPSGALDKSSNEVASEHTSPASFAYTLVLVSVAVPCKM